MSKEDWIKFFMWATGHNKGTVLQLLHDWQHKEVLNDSVNTEVQTMSEHFQEDCHKVVEVVMNGNKKATHQDATNVWIFTKLAELQIQINKLQHNMTRP